MVGNVCYVIFIDFWWRLKLLDDFELWLVQPGWVSPLSLNFLTIKPCYRKWIQDHCIHTWEWILRQVTRFFHLMDSKSLHSKQASTFWVVGSVWYVILMMVLNFGWFQQSQPSWCRLERQDSHSPCHMLHSVLCTSTRTQPFNLNRKCKLSELRICIKNVLFNLKQYHIRKHKWYQQFHLW